jgi:5-aminolevulinate synthase
VGGYIAGPEALVDVVRSTAPGFIFTTSLPPAIAGAALASVSFLRRNRERPQALLQNVSYLRSCLEQTGMRTIRTDSHIVPLIVGDPFICSALSQCLLERHAYYVQPINYPSVPRGQERFRITLTPDHTFAMIECFIEALAELWAEFKLPCAA